VSVYYQMLVGDALERLGELADRSVHCIVTSPPYWNLRDYGVAGQIGLEPTIEEYLARMVGVFRECRRVLRKEGTCWVNMGDGYAADGEFGGATGGKQAYLDDNNRKRVGREKRRTGLKAKDLIGMPWRLAFALQADGWWLRSDIIWHKPSCMPESVGDRPTKDHEYLFLLSKSAKYFYDGEAIREPAAADTHARYARGRGDNHKWSDGGPGDQSIARSFEHMLRPGVNPKAAADIWQGRANSSFSGAVKDIVGFRNKRTVWSIVSEGFTGAHFATFPPALVEPCILSGTSAKGCCPACGAPWARIVETHGTTGKSYNSHKKDLEVGMRVEQRRDSHNHEYGVETIGWRPTCACFSTEVKRYVNADHGESRPTRVYRTEYAPNENCPAPVPCTVLDPFGGSGTTVMVALRHGRRGVMIEIKPEYVAMARRRIEGDCPLFNVEQS
jgi:DNA modification methylase